MGEETADIVEAYRLSVADAMREYHTQFTGLSRSEAISRQTRFGLNKLIPPKKDSLALRFGRQFKDLMLILLLLSSAFSFTIGETQTGIILLVIVLVNATIGFTQEFKAEKVMESLEKLVVPLAKVKRDGRLTEIPSEDLVPGDIIYVEEGDSVPADVRVLEEIELSTNDFALTGESNPSRKFTHAIAATVPLANRHNLLFMGTTVATGDGTCLVIATGMETELGRIASLSGATKTVPVPCKRR